MMTDAFSLCETPFFCSHVYSYFFFHISSTGHYLQRSSCAAGGGAFTREQFHLHGTESSKSSILQTGRKKLWECIKVWGCRPTSLLTHMTPGIISTRRPALQSTSLPPESLPCCPPCPTCRPATRPISLTASVGTMAGPRQARTALHSRPAALTLHMAFPTRTVRLSAATQAGTRHIRARWFLGMALGWISTEARWCARSEAPTPARTRTWARRWRRPPGRQAPSRAEWSVCRDGMEVCPGEGPVWVSTGLKPDFSLLTDYKVNFGSWNLWS